MWIRLLLLVAFAVGLNWVISEHVKKQQLREAFQTTGDNELYSYDKMTREKMREADRIIAHHRKELFYKRA